MLVVVASGARLSSKPKKVCKHRQHPTKCFDCENGKASSLDYVLGFPAPMAKMGP